MVSGHPIWLLGSRKFWPDRTSSGANCPKLSCVANSRGRRDEASPTPAFCAQLVTRLISVPARFAGAYSDDGTSGGAYIYEDFADAGPKRINKRANTRPIITMDFESNFIIYYTYEI